MDYGVCETGAGLVSGDVELESGLLRGFGGGEGLGEGEEEGGGEEEHGRVSLGGGSGGGDGPAEGVGGRGTGERYVDRIRGPIPLAEGSAIYHATNSTATAGVWRTRAVVTYTHCSHMAPAEHAFLVNH